MKITKTILSFVVFCCITNSVHAQFITVIDTKTATDLVNLLTGGSSCVSPSNEFVKGDGFTPGKNSFGSFDTNGSGFPLSSGIVLSTGSAKSSVGPYTQNPGEGTSDWSGDIDLQKALGINLTQNATILGFDFVASTDLISFDYIFASNEYQDNYPCSYSDGFAFLIKEKNTPNAEYENIAVLDDGTPVSSTSIRPKIENFISNGTSFPGCDPQNEEYFDPSNPNPNPINYSGQTKKLTAKKNVEIGVSYHVKLVIADQKDKDRDSAVFIEAGSFSPKIDLGPDRLLTTSTHVCFGESLTINTTYIGNNYKWYNLDVSATTDIGTTSSLTINDAGTYKVEVTLASGCVATGKIKVEFAPEIKINNSPLTKCDDNGNGTATFDLNEAETDLLTGNPTTTTIKYFETETTSGLSDIILDPSSFNKTDLNNQTVYAQLTNVYGCDAVAKITLQTYPSVLDNSTNNPKPIINEFSGEGNSVTLVPATTTSIYEYSLDGSNYQASPLFTNLEANSYIGYIRDSSTCKYSINPFVILDYPHFFTPNGDGINDEWKIENLTTNYPGATISIINRYGKLLKQIKEGESWDGTFNGFLLPADDYWFIIDLKNGEIVKGHFSLKR
jgi:gliding motility-associated-like protein